MRSPLPVALFATALLLRGTIGVMPFCGDRGGRPNGASAPFVGRTRECFGIVRNPQQVRKEAVQSNLVQLRVRISPGLRFSALNCCAQVDELIAELHLAHPAATLAEGFLQWRVTEFGTIFVACFQCVVVASARLKTAYAQAAGF